MSFTKKGFSCLYLRYLVPDEADYIMREVHEGVCGNHSGAQSLVHKLIRARYYWPTMQKKHLVLREGMQQMPTLEKHYMTTIRTAHLNERSLAIHSMGARHNGTLPHGNATAQVPRHRDRLFH